MARKRTVAAPKLVLSDWGMTFAEYDAMWVRQGGSCEICGVADTSGSGLIPDHANANKAGRVQALLCVSCKNMLIRFGYDAELMRSAAAYYEHHRAKAAAKAAAASVATG